jgi:Neocarzinostatin family
MRVKSKLGLRLAAVGIVAGAVGLPIVGATAAQGVTTKAITVTPNTGVTAGESLTVAGTGFAASAPVYIVECSALTGSAACTSTPVTATASGAGAFSATFAAVGGTVGSGTCNDGQTCDIVATDNPADNTAARFASITFGGAITVTPSTGVKSGSKVTVAGSGFPDSKALFVVLCSNPLKQADCDTADGILGTQNTSATGTFSVQITVKTGKYGDASCVAGGTCTIGATTDTSGVDKRQSAAATVTFAGGTATGPQLTVTPSKALKNGQKVTVTGKAFPQHSATLYVLECSSTTKGSTYCDTTGIVISTTSKTGTFSLKFPVIVGSAFTKSGAKGSCAAGKTCFIVASTSTTGVAADSGAAAITLAGSKITKVTPKISAKKTSKGIAGVVKVSGKGFKGLKVELLKGSKVLKKATTGKGGKYSFKETKAGKYKVKTVKKTKGSKEYVSVKSKTVTIK